MPKSRTIVHAVISPLRSRTHIDVSKTDPIFYASKINVNLDHFHEQNNKDVSIVKPQR